MLGPLFRYELTRLARRGLQPKLRAAFAGLLLVVLLLAYLAAFPDVSPLQLLTHIDEPLTTESASRFGERFAVAFLFVQAAVVVLVTPAVAAGAIGEEKDHGSLDLLLTTELSSWEIVVGKLAARLVFIAAILLTGLPAVILVTFFGGADPDQLLAGYAIALLTTLSLAAFTLWLTATHEKSGHALVRAYVWGIGLSVFGLACSCMYFPAFLSPLGALMVMFDGTPRLFGSKAGVQLASLLGAYAVLHLGLALGFALAAIPRIRESGPAPDRDGRPGRYEDQPPIINSTRLPSQYRAPPRRLLTRPTPGSADDDPLGWKERYFGGWDPLLAGPELFTLAMLLLPLAAIVFVLAAFAGREAAGVFRVFAVGFGVVGLVVAGFRATRSVAEERSRGTLDALLMLPVPRRDILRAKARAAWRAALPFGLGLFAVVWLGLVRRALSPAALAAPVVLLGWVLGTVGFGLWLSVRCRTRERALGWFLGLGLAATVLSPLLGNVFLRAGGTEGAVLGAALNGLSPPVSLWAAVPPARFGESQFQFDDALAASLLVGFLGWCFWLLAARGFERRDC